MKTIIIFLLTSLPLILTGQNEKGGRYVKLADFPSGMPMQYGGLTIAARGDILILDYDKYMPYVGTFNDSISSVNGTLRFDVGYSYKRHYFGIQYGYSRIAYDTDSLDIRFRNNQYALNYGYSIINTWQFTVRPTVSLKWNRGRLINYPNGRADLEDYLSGRDLDLRMNQPLGYIGVEADYKFYRKSLAQYYTIGLYAGYVFKMIPNAIVNSRFRNIHNPPPIGLRHVTGGLYVATNLDFFFSRSRSGIRWGN